MRFILNFFQVILILFWCAFCGLLGVVIMVFAKETAGKIRFINSIWSPVILFLTGTKIELEDLHDVKGGPYIYVANHTSSLDIAIVVHTVKKGLFFVCKQELKKIPVVGWYIQASGMIFVDRGNREKAARSLKSAAQKIKAGKNVITFPEGTRTKDGKLKMFRKGSFIIAREENIGIVPIAISGAFDINPAGSYAIYPGTVKVTIGTPVYPDDHKEKTTEQLAMHVQKIVAEHQAKHAD